jgi:hypothetical protein
MQSAKLAARHFSVTICNEANQRWLSGSHSKELSRSLTPCRLTIRFFAFDAIRQLRMRRAGHVTRIGERRGAYRFWWGKLRERDHFEDPG